MFLHHLPGLSGDVVAADQRSGRVDGILPARREWSSLPEE
jgi:hypothetical protein